MIIPKDVESKYRFIVLAGERVSQLQKGAKPRLDKTDGMKHTRIAIEELEKGELNMTDRPSKAELAAMQAEEEKAAAKAAKKEAKSKE